MYSGQILQAQQSAHSLAGAAAAASSLAPPSRRQLRKSDHELHHRQRSRSRSPTASSSSSSPSSSSASSWRTAGKRRTFSMRDLLHRSPEHSSTSALLAASLFSAAPPSSSSGSGSSGDDTPSASGAELGWPADSSPPQRRRRDKLKAFLRTSGEECHSLYRQQQHQHMPDDEVGDGSAEEKRHHRHRHRHHDMAELELDEEHSHDHHRHRHHRKYMAPQRCATESSLCHNSARAGPLTITVDDASPLSSPETPHARDDRPSSPLGGRDDGGDHQNGPTPRLAFAGPLAEGAAAAVVASATAVTRPHSRTSGAEDRAFHPRPGQEHPQRQHAPFVRSESAPAFPPVTPSQHSSLAAIERAFPSAHQHDQQTGGHEVEESDAASAKRRNRMARVREKRAADRSASHAVLYFPGGAGEEAVIRERERPRRHWHHHHEHSPVGQAQEMVEEAKAIAHFPPPRLYGSSRLSAALPPGSPAPPPAAVDHSGETKAEGNTKTDEEEDLPDFPFPVSPSDTWALMQTMQQFYHSGRTIINHDTIVGRKLYNFRDLSDATQSTRHGVKVAPQRIFRSACLSRGDVDHVDVVKSLIYLRDFVKVKTMIDFRNKDERMSDPLDAVVDAVYPRERKGVYVEAGTCKRYNIPLMNKSFKIMGLFLPSKWGTKMNMVKAVMYGSDKTPTEIFAEEAMNPMGLLGLNKLMLTYGKEEIAQVLRLCANSTNYPIMYHCSSGKDRTGLITALILLCCGVDAQDIITNYHESEIFLSPVMDRINAENQAKGLNTGFDGTPPEVMEQTIEFIFQKWGSVTGYFGYIGFSSRDQMKLVQHLTRK